MNNITEQRNPASMNLDRMSTQEILLLMNEQDYVVTEAIQRALPDIEKLIDAVVNSFNHGGRLIYIGAGTSGRLGILDAVECVPTFGTSPDKVIGLIAGGDSAIKVAVEGAEDSKSLGHKDLKDIALTDKDIVIGIAASGRTPYVIGGLEYANEIGAVTGSLSNNEKTKISAIADLPIEIVTGPEILTGSTRLKAGTSQKLVLNMISTVSMIKTGKVYENLMVNVQATNDKLVDRSKRIIVEATGVSYEKAEAIYEEAQSVKTAIVMILADTTKTEAERALAETNEFIYETLQKFPQKVVKTENEML